MINNLKLIKNVFSARKKKYCEQNISMWELLFFQHHVSYKKETFLSIQFPNNFNMLLSSKDGSTTLILGFSAKDICSVIVGVAGAPHDQFLLHFENCTNTQ